MAFILQNLTDQSLVIIDELGRGTSNLDGISLAFSIGEALLSSAAYTLFVSHYVQISSLSDLYPNVSNVHLKTSLGVLTDGLKYLHKVGSGPCDMKSGYVERELFA